jgi:hypothetical protein
MIQNPNAECALLISLSSGRLPVISRWPVKYLSDVLKFSPLRQIDHQESL